MYQTMDWKKKFQVEISPLASYAGEGLDKYKGTTLTAPCSINKVTLLVIFVSDVGCLTLLHIGGLTKVIFSGGYAEWYQLKDLFRLWCAAIFHTKNFLQHCILVFEPKCRNDMFSYDFNQINCTSAFFVIIPLSGIHMFDLLYILYSYQ